MPVTAHLVNNTFHIEPGNLVGIASWFTKNPGIYLHYVALIRCQYWALKSYSLVSRGADGNLFGTTCSLRALRAQSSASLNRAVNDHCKQSIISSKVKRTIADCHAGYHTKEANFMLDNDWTMDIRLYLGSAVETGAQGLQNLQQNRVVVTFHR